MATTYDDEATTFDNEGTTFDTPSQASTPSTPATTAERPLPGETTKPVFEKKNRRRMWRNAALAGTGALLIGGVLTATQGQAMNPDKPAAGATSAGDGHQGHDGADQQPDNGTQNENGTTENGTTTESPTYQHPDWTDESMKVAHGVDDGMDFAEAFEAAREEVGPGGCFEWRGGVYGTYSADEWKALSPEEQTEYRSHFVWNLIDTTPVDDEPTDNVTLVADEPAPTDNPAEAVEEDDDIEVVVVEGPGWDEVPPGDVTVEVDGPPVYSEPEPEVIPPFDEDDVEVAEEYFLGTDSDPAMPDDFDADDFIA